MWLLNLTFHLFITTYSFPVYQTVKMSFYKQDHDFHHVESTLPLLPLLWENFHISFSYHISFWES